MSNTDRAIAAEARRIDQRAAQAACAYWYACGYNDHREGKPYVDPHAFAEVWLTVNDAANRPSLQDAFKAFERQCFMDRLLGRTPPQAGPYEPGVKYETGTTHTTDRSLKNILGL